MITPPAPIWRDPVSGLAVYVRGGLIELWFQDSANTLLPSQADEFADELATAIAEATAWCERWDIVTGDYEAVDA